MRRIIYLFFVLLSMVSSAHADTSKFYTLKNGLHLLVKVDHRAPVAIFQIWYRVGGSYEKNGLTGISHVVEHMMFEGTKYYPEETFAKVVADNGGQFNAFTTDDYTVYFEKLSANKIALSFKLEADRMQNALMSDKSFKKEIQVVMEERRMRYDDQPTMLLYERLRAAAFISNPYHHLTIGWMGDLQHLTAQDVRSWYHQWYVPNNATIVIVGDVDPEKMFVLAKKYFAMIKKQPLPVEKPLVIQKPAGKRIVNLSLPAKVPFLFMSYNVPTLTTGEKPWQIYALDVLSAILAGSDSSRLPRILVRQQQLATSISTDYNDTDRFNTLFIIEGVPTAQSSLIKLRKAILQEIKALQTKPVSAAELSRVKTQVIANKVYAEDSITTQASQLGSFVSVGLPWQLTSTYVTHIKAITAAQVQAVAKQFLQPQRLTVGMLHPLPMKATAHAKQVVMTHLDAQGVN